MSSPFNILTLTFHGLGEPTRLLPPGEDAYWIDRNFYAAILDQVVGRADIQITFDDANESDYTIGFPELLSRQLKARFFVVADRIDRPGFLSRNQIQAMCREGMDIQNHGMRHVPWRNCNAPELQEELVSARDQIEQVTAQPVTEAACPYGSYDRLALKILRRSGYQKVYTSDGGATSESTWLHPRNTIVRGHTLEQVSALIASPFSTTGIPWRNIKMALKSWR